MVRRLVTTSILVMCVPISAGGCDGCHDCRSNTERPIVMNPLLPFKAKFQISDKELVLTYEVENRSTRDVYMMDRLERGRPYTADPNIIYAHLDHDTKTVWLNKVTPEIPEGKHPDPPHFPLFYTPLRAGTKAREEIRVPLPIREWREYNAYKGEGHLVNYRHVYFTLQYYWRTDGMTEIIDNFDGQKVIYTRGGVPLKNSDFGLLQTELVTISLPVLEREEAE